ncbi:MAG TPA: hypothetical protein PLO52_07555 [Flavobacterium alvei]|nr:hypothetical protein [Flavobacterium alvei]HQF47405.1 hypothetical protein [Flavobacterium alvei]HQK39956.1 hypothetical protein [Flavobacterium alvei]
MDNQDKIFDKIKNAAHKAEEKDFPGMERIWQRVDAKLEQKELQSKNKNWKKIAIAASVILLVSLGYQFLKPTEITSIDNEVVVKKVPSKNILKKAIVSSQIDTAKVINVLNETKTTLVEKENQSPVVASSAMASAEKQSEMADGIIASDYTKSEKETILRNKTNTFRNQVFDAIVVRSAYSELEKKKQKDSIAPQKAAETNGPLVVVNGNLAQTKFKSVQEAKKEMPKKLDNEEIESLIVLKEPLYIINGVEYTEESLFGTHPTSPYAPLNKQKIETLTILQDDEAIEKYGEKGSKGVVIITTKNRVPIQK